MKFLFLTFSFFLLQTTIFSQNVGIGATSPTNTLHVIVSPTNPNPNPVRFEGIQRYTTEDSVLVVNPSTGVIKYMPIADVLANIPPNVLDSLILNSVINNTDTIYNNQSMRDSIIAIALGNSDTLFSTQTFRDSVLGAILSNMDTIFTITRDSLLNDSTFINTLRDSIDTDIDSVTFANDTIYIYENGTIVQTYINTSLDTALVDSLIFAKSDSLYTLIKDSLLNDTAWLNELQDSSEWIDGAKVGLTPGAIYARKALARGDTVTIDTNGQLGVGISTPKEKLHLLNSSASIKIESTGSPVGTFVKLQVDNSNNVRAKGIVTLDTISKTSWFYGNPYNGGAINESDKFVINRLTNYNSNLDDRVAAYRIGAVPTGSKNLFTVDTNGNIGIGGIKSPTNTLDIGGKTRIRTINDTNNVVRVLTANDSGVIQSLSYDTLLNAINDSSEWIDGAKVGLTPGAIYARKALENGDTLMIDTNGRFGIGTNTPESSLNVNYDKLRIGSDKNIFWTDLNENRLEFNRAYFPSYIDQSGNKGSIVFRVNNGLGITDPTSHTMILDSNNNVGIGTTSPITKLHIKSDQSNVITIQNSIYDKSDNIANNYLSFTDSNNVSYGTVGDNSNSRKQIGLVGSQNHSVVLASFNTVERTRINLNLDTYPAAITFGNKGNINAIIDSNGNIGIGTTTPVEKLVVNNGSIMMENNANGPEQLYLYYISPTNYASLGTSSGGGIEFNTGTTSPTTKMYLSPNDGNLGIGTTTPTIGKVQVRQTNDISNGGISLTNAASSAGMRLWMETSNTGHIDVGSSGTYNLILNEGGGYIGIGDPNPQNNLHVTSSSTEPVPLRLERLSGQTVAQLFKNNQDSIYFGLSDNEDFAIGANEDLTINPYLTIDHAGATGNVGVNTTAPTSMLHVNGAIATPIVTTAANITLDNTHSTVIVTGGTPTITLPAATGISGRKYILVNQTATPITTSINYIDFTGSAIGTIPANSSITIQSDGTSWYRVQ